MIQGSIRAARCCALALAGQPALPQLFRKSRAQAQSDANEAKGTDDLRTVAREPRTGHQGTGREGDLPLGEVQPSVVCSPLQVCDIELQPGEIVRDVLVGDTVRWKVEPATSGAAGGQAIHLIVKPSEPGLVTSMVVTTSRRTYHIQLKSHPSQYMARVGFDYPEDVSTRLPTSMRVWRRAPIPGAGVPAEQLNFGYSMSGSARWRPTRVYSDGHQDLHPVSALTLRPGCAGPLRRLGRQNRIVNYRMKGNMMVVDSQFSCRASTRLPQSLSPGVGWRQQKITIRAGRVAALKTWGYAVVSDQDTKDDKLIELAYVIDSHDGQVLARLSTGSIDLGRAYTTTATGAAPVSALSVMRRG
jgi:type IV secretion system protein VirB9